MRRPIKPSEVRKGDLIRWEDAGFRTDYAIEYRATYDGYVSAGGGQYYLLDRPQPAVDLPTEPTFGLLSWISGLNTEHPGRVVSAYDQWCVGKSVSGYRDVDQVLGSAHMSKPQISIARVTAFTPATAVPTDALDKLRWAFSGRLGCPDMALPDAVRALFTAVDAANEVTA